MLWAAFELPLLLRRRRLAACSRARAELGAALLPGAPPSRSSSRRPPLASPRPLARPRSAAACVHIFPAVLSLATNFKGYAAFGRLLGDGKPALLEELDIKQVSPLFSRERAVAAARL